MSAIAPALEALTVRIAGLTAEVGSRVDVMAMGVLDRAGHLDLDPPSQVSPNRACRLIRAADGWMALNLAREEDRDLVPAWLGCDFGGDAWDLVESHASLRTRADLVQGAGLLGLPAAAVGEARSGGARTVRIGTPRRRTGALRVVDLSALWAGPMCGAILASAGAEVVKVESPRRPDPTRETTPAFFRALNGGKSHRSLDLAGPELRDLICAADVLITSARPRAFEGPGLTPDAVFAANPGLVWVAITGHGWTGEAARRVGFGDDTAAAGELVRWLSAGPEFLGDALADPLTGLAAAIGALEAAQAGGGLLVDVAMARCAADAAVMLGLKSAA